MLHRCESMRRMLVIRDFGVDVGLKKKNWGFEMVYGL